MYKIQNILEFSIMFFIHYDYLDQATAEDTPGCMFESGWATTSRGPWAKQEGVDNRIVRLTQKKMIWIAQHLMR